MRRDSFMYTIGFTFVAAFVVSGTLNWVHTGTATRVALADRERYERTVLDALGIAAGDQDEVFARYAALDIDATGSTPLYRYTVDGDSRVATTFVGPGVWGDISGAIALSLADNRIAGVRVMAHNETPGLGGRVTEPEFLNQFNGEQIAATGIAMVRGPGDSDPDNSSVDAITGASGTSRAFAAIINDSIARLRRYTVALR